MRNFQCVSDSQNKMYKNFRTGISELSKRRNFSELVRISFWEKSNNLRFVYIANTIFI